MRQRGMTLVELVITVAVAVFIATACVRFSQGMRVYAARSSAQRFDAALSYAQSLAATAGGVTLVFKKSTASGGTVIPGFVLVISSALGSAAPIVAQGNVAEARLGAPPLRIVLDAAGHARCPAGESTVVLTFTDPRATQTRVLPCNTPVAGAPVSPATVPP